MVRKLNANADKTVIFAHIMNRDAAGKDSELAAADYKGSVCEADITEGLFDGPEISAVLAKTHVGSRLPRDGPRWVMQPSTSRAAQSDDVLLGACVLEVPWEHYAPQRSASPYAGALARGVSGQSFE